MALGALPESPSENEDEAAVFAEINITPLTDVFLVLLIIFMVSSSAMNNAGVKVNLPKSGAASSASAEKGITVTLDSKGTIFLGDKPIALSGLEAALRAELQTKENKSVILAGDQEVLLGVALNVMNLAKKAGAEKFGIATKGKGQENESPNSSN